jgi:hypothetical protein
VVCKAFDEFHGSQRLGKGKGMLSQFLLPRGALSSIMVLSSFLLGERKLIGARDATERHQRHYGLGGKEV